jgi:tetratricopeptide (TPR) repeat protein
MGLFDSIMQKYTEHRERILPVAIAVGAIAVIVLGYQLIQSFRDRTASALLAEAAEYYSPSPGIPPDFAKAFEMYRGIGEKYGSTLSGAIANYYAANSLMNLGRTGEAIKEYQAFVKKHSGRAFLAGLAYQRMGYACLSTGDQAAAVAAFEEADKRIGPSPATVELAQLYEQTGNAAKSQEKYKKISEGLAGTRWAFEAMRKLPPPVLAPPPGQQPAPSAPPAEQKKEQN